MVYIGSLDGKTINVQSFKVNVFVLCSCVTVIFLLCVFLCVNGAVEAPGRASYHKYHIPQGWCLGRSRGCLLGQSTAEVWPHRLVNGTKGKKKIEPKTRKKYIHMVIMSKINNLTGKVCQWKVAEPSQFVSPPVLVWNKQVLVNWQRAAAAEGSSSFGSQGPPDKHGWVSQGEELCWVGRPEARCWEAGWPYWRSRAERKQGGNQDGKEGN